MKGIASIILLPFAVIYNLITSIRNKLFDWKVFKEVKPKQFTISVGNLRVGGSGKTPFIKYLIRSFPNHETAVLSRGYGRKSKGFRKVTNTSTTLEVGDEPKMLSTENTQVYVCENRLLGAKIIEKEQPNTAILLLDDSFQHRRIKPNLNILITEYEKPIFKDFLLPMGRLRESRNGAKRADIIIVSKVPKSINSSDKKTYLADMRKYTSKDTPVFFCHYNNTPCENVNAEKLNQGSSVIVCCGLANNSSFIDFCKNNFDVIKAISFNDHHNYTQKELDSIFAGSDSIKVLTTAKDYIKLKDICSKNQLSRLYRTDTEVSFVDNEAEFKSLVLNAFEAHL